MYYERVLGAATDERDRGDTISLIAKSYLLEGRLEDAKAQFEGLIARYKNDPSPYMKSKIQDAKHQLDLIAQLNAKKN
jgi:hypothetical protein